MERVVLDLSIELRDGNLLQACLIKVDKRDGLVITIYLQYLSVLNLSILEYVKLNALWIFCRFTVVEYRCGFLYRGKRKKIEMIFFFFRHCVFDINIQYVILQYSMEFPF